MITNGIEALPRLPRKVVVKALDHPYDQDILTRISSVPAASMVSWLKANHLEHLQKTLLWDVLRTIHSTSESINALAKQGRDLQPFRDRYGYLLSIDSSLMTPYVAQHPADIDLDMLIACFEMIRRGIHTIPQEAPDQLTRDYRTRLFHEAMRSSAMGARLTIPEEAHLRATAISMLAHYLAQAVPDAYSDPFEENVSKPIQIDQHCVGGQHVHLVLQTMYTHASTLRFVFELKLESSFFNPLHFMRANLLHPVYEGHPTLVDPSGERYLIRKSGLKSSHATLGDFTSQWQVVVYPKPESTQHLTLHLDDMALEVHGILLDEKFIQPHLLFTIPIFGHCEFVLP